MRKQRLKGLAADIGAGNLRLQFQPGFDTLTHLCSCQFGLAIRRADATAGGQDAAAKLVALIIFDAASFFLNYKALHDYMTPGIEPR